MHSALFLFVALLPLGYAQPECKAPTGNYGDVLKAKMEAHRGNLSRFDPFVIAPTKKFFVGFSHFSMAGAVNGLKVRDFSKYKACNVHAEMNEGSTDFDITVYNEQVVLEGGVQLDVELFKLNATKSASLSVTLTNAGVQTSGTAKLVDGRKKLSNFKISHFFDKFEVKISCPGVCKMLLGFFQVNEKLSKLGDKFLQAAQKLDPLEAKVVEAIMNKDHSQIKSLVEVTLDKFGKNFGDKLKELIRKGKGKELIPGLPFHF